MFSMHQVKVAVVLLIGALNVLSCYSAIPNDRIEALPGWSGALPSPQYSGYIKLDPSNGKELFYWFVESERDPENDPVVLWLNGGPGCSSLFGYLVEQGPFLFDHTSENLTLPTLVRNPYAWSKIANMIYLESPAGVGFSYSTNPGVDYVTNDDQTATDNYNFLVQFFSYYPEFKQNDFYITGESYAGIYIPMLANTIRVMSSRVPLDQRINLKGFMVGNGCVGNMVGGCGPISGSKIQVEFYHGHALISDALYDRIMNTCNFEQSLLTQQCHRLLKEMTQTVGKIYVYNIYEICENSQDRFGEDRARNPLKMLFHSTVQAQLYSAPWVQPQAYNGPDDFDCIVDVLLERYLNNPLVRAAIHVKQADEPHRWVDCAPKSCLVYHRSIASLIPIYPTLIQQYRTVIFNGDIDSCVPFIGNEQWTSSLGFKIKEGWRPWLVDDQVAGYVTEYDVNNFTFLTVKGAGHMVPQFKPKQAYAMFERFINRQRF